MADAAVLDGHVRIVRSGDEDDRQVFRVGAADPTEGRERADVKGDDEGARA